MKIVQQNCSFQHRTGHVLHLHVLNLKKKEKQHSFPSMNRKNEAQIRTIITIKQIRCSLISSFMQGSHKSNTFDWS